MSITVNPTTNNPVPEKDIEISKKGRKYTSIYLSSLNDEQLEIARNCNTNNDKRLSGDEIELFLSQCEDKNVVYNPGFFKRLSNKIRGFFANLFSRNVKEDTKEAIVEKTSVKTYGNYEITKENNEENAMSKMRQINIDNTKGQAGDAEVKIEITNMEDGNIKVYYDRNQWAKQSLYTHKAEFTYNKEDIENHIIYESYDDRHEERNSQSKIKYFKNIPEIRRKPEKDRTNKEKTTLKEFDNLINYIINAGIDYGVDPRAIVAIIQEETKFVGSKVNNNGSGYMQITLTAIGDLVSNTNKTINYETIQNNGETKYKINNYTFDNYFKLPRYGTELIDLCNSRGFDLKNTMSDEEKVEFLSNLLKYIKENEDYEFNIRLGAILLRHELYEAKGDFQKAAKKYNDNENLREEYAKRTNTYYNELMDGYPQTKYDFETDDNPASKKS